MIVYKITNTLNNKAYVGQSQYSLNERWSKHKSDAKRSDKNTHFYKAIRKYGTDCWKLEVLEEVENVKLLNEAEMKWIEYYDTFNRDKGYNSTKGGENGFIFSEEIKEKRKNNHCSKKEDFIPPMLGKHHTEESKEKMRQARLGKNHTEETKEKLRQVRVGKKFSKEHKEKIRQAKLNMSEKTKEKMRQAHKEWWRKKKEEKFI